MDALSIGEVARRAGVAASTIRYYESIALLPPARRVGGRRQYDAAILDRLAFIQTTQRLGFTLAEIQRLFHHDHEAGETPLPARWRALARRKIGETDRLIAHATAVRRLLVQGLRCNCPNLHDCINCVLLRCAGGAPTPADAATRGGMYPSPPET